MVHSPDGWPSGWLDELSVGDAMVGVAHHELDRLPLSGVPIGEAASLVEGPAPDGGDFIGKLHLPVAMTLMVDEDGWVRGRGHQDKGATSCTACHP